MHAMLKSAIAAGCWASMCAALRVAAPGVGAASVNGTAPVDGNVFNQEPVEALRSGLVVEPENLTFVENIPQVPGMLEVRKAELEGVAPQLVDAFFDANGSSVFVIFNTNLLRGNRHDNYRPYDKYFAARWLCEWSAPDDASLFGSTPSWGEIVTDGVEEERANRGMIWTWRKDSEDSDVTDRGDEADDPDVTGFDAHRHSLVLRCPVPSSGKPPTSVRVTVFDGEHAYHYRSVNVGSSSLLQPSDTAICTMMIKDAVARPYLPEWVAYHLSIGFDQILIYIEDPDPTWASKLLKDFLQRGNVRLVHFYFSGVSSRRKFLMQQAQEQHCLYQAKGRVKWLAGIDADEYFQIMGPWQRMGDFLKERGNLNTAAFNVRSQFWYAGNDTYQKRTPLVCLPCDMMCKPNGYFKATVRSKLILHVGNVAYYSVHMLTASEGTMIVPDPDMELRLNHFKSIPDGLGTDCMRDHSFVGACRRLLHAGYLTADRSRRCSPHFAVEEFPQSMQVKRSEEGMAKALQEIEERSAVRRKHLSSTIRTKHKQ